MKPEVVVLDIKLGPNRSGLDLLQEIRGQDHALPVILSTAYDSFQHDLKSIAAYYYVVKSVDLGELKSKVALAIEKYKASARGVRPFVAACRAIPRHAFLCVGFCLPGPKVRASRLAMSFDIAAYVREIALLAVPLLIAVTFHEVAHGYVAYLLGDPTAKAAGRLTLNPLKHLDLLGVLAFLLTRMIGWAKPVPVDARYFKNPPRGMILVSLAGPAMNFLLAAVFSVLFRLVGGLAVAAGRRAWGPCSGSRWPTCVWPG